MEGKEGRGKGIEKKEIEEGEGERKGEKEGEDPTKFRWVIDAPGQGSVRINNLQPLTKMSPIGTCCWL